MGYSGFLKKFLVGPKVCLCSIPTNKVLESMKNLRISNNY